MRSVTPSQGGVPRTRPAPDAEVPAQPTPTGATGEQLAASVTALLEGVLASVADLGAVTEQALAAGPGARPVVADLDPLEVPVRRLLADTAGLVVGAGFVAAPALLADAPYWLQWWTVESPGGPPSRLRTPTDERAEGFRDYTALPWFAVPVATGRRHVTGPYVDYVCTDEYSLTFTAPVTGRHGVAGVAGADVYVRHLERRLLPRLRSAAREAGAGVALVNAQGRVVCGSGAGAVTGALVRDVPVAELWGRAPEGGAAAGRDAVLHRCGDLPLGVLVRSV